MSEKGHLFFLPHARLNRGQRRYCHCLMKARTQRRGNHYSFCKGVAKADQNKSKKITPASRARQYQFDIAKTNCVMSYDYNDYTVAEVRAFCKEKGLPIRDPKTKTYYPRARLVQLLTTHYLQKHKTA